ncbi:hypothetical protein [Maribacter arenosus]|uniref:Uncharacterized protein n=1 Tax=Maribacter arenosus TaxID=1854708 RepID=A0ABR7VAS4_9FLAO|nr:hypothetical protein [Maribacter arenosus]MBD0850765.1 hypothetical protein [Maribacter arenosus]
MTYILDLFSDLYFLGLLSMLVAFLLSIRMFALTIYFIRTKNLKSEPIDRRKYTLKTTFLGSAGLFATFSLVLVIFGIYAGLDLLDLAKLISLSFTIVLLFWGLRITLNGLIGRYNELSVDKEVISKVSLQKTIQSSIVSKVKSTTDNDIPIGSLQERAVRFTEERAAKFTEESHFLRRRKIAKGYAEEFKKITAQSSNSSIEEESSAHNDSPILSLPASTERLAKAKKSKFRRGVAKGFKEVGKQTELH